MATKRQVDLSMGTTEQAHVSDKLMEEQLASQMALQDAAAANPTPEVIKTDTKYVLFKLVNTSRKGRLNVDGIDDVINPKTGKMERIRLLAGVDTIWQKEQKDISEDYVRQNRRSLQFEGKFCRIPEWDHTALEFARVCRSFVESPAYKQRGSKHAFFEWNPARMAEAKANMQKKKLDAMQKALSVGVEQMRKHAFYLGVQPVDEVGIPKTDEGIRNDYFAKAEQDPNRFLESFEQPVVNISYLVKKAITEGKIDLGRKPGSLFWAANGGHIGDHPQTQTPAEYLISLAMGHTNEGKLFLDTLQSISG